MWKLLITLNDETKLARVMHVDEYECATLERKKNRGRGFDMVLTRRLTARQLPQFLDDREPLVRMRLFDDIFIFL